MTPRFYETFVQRLTLAGFSDTERVVMGALGLTGEAGEVADLLKKALFHQRDPVAALPLATRDALLSELGDVLWYLTLLASCFDWSLIDVMTANVLKLRARCPQGGATPARRCCVVCGSERDVCDHCGYCAACIPDYGQEGCDEEEVLTEGEAD
ncbi:MAG: nucleoside triphosphate pyrophosphohydrolase family protein [Ktedonobacterales bacterium]|nr:nucleoside triphosphate pyrophosphohydrolase family protein [Ktedonobacterales bacterium]